MGKNEGFFVEDDVYQPACLRVAVRNQRNRPHVGETTR